MSSLDINIRSKIPSPVSFDGYPVQPATIEAAVYDGTPLRFFLGRRGADPNGYRRFLRGNQIGRAFDLEAGRQVYLDTSTSSNSNINQ